MIHVSSRHLLALGCVLAGWSLLAADPPSQPKLDLSEYRTVEKAITARVSLAPGRIGQTGYLGVTLQRDKSGRLLVEEVQPDSPAAKAGLKKGDIVTRIGEQAVKTPEAFREWLQTRGSGESVKIGLLREDKSTEVTATLRATSSPKKANEQRVLLGVELGEVKEGEGVKIERVTTDSPAATAGLKSGDYLNKINDLELRQAGALADILADKSAGDVVALVVRRDGKTLEMKATLAADRGPGRPPFAREGAPPTVWKKEVFRLGVVCIEFPDVKHNDKVPVKEWEAALFSRSSYTKTSATGQTVYGSLNDYYQEQSGGAFRIEGKVFNWVEVSKKRADYAQGTGTTNKTALPVEALDKVTARDGKDAFKDLDGFLFIYAGDRVQTNRGSLYFPHAGSLSHQSKRWPYLLGAEGGSRMTTISGLVKEFAQVLGLPDLAARTENAGSEGLGVWCALSNTVGNGKPQHLCAWAKEKLGWVKPTVIDPTVKQKLILSPIEDSPKECYKVLVRPDGSEYFLLENRRKKGFDGELPGEGMLIWRVVHDHPILEESHGIEGPTGPLVQLGAVPYPSPANNAFTPDTTPSSHSPLGGGLPVHITEVRRLPDGRITFHIGYEYR